MVTLLGLAAYACLGLRIHSDQTEVVPVRRLGEKVYSRSYTLLIGDTARPEGGKEFKQSLEDFSSLFGQKSGSVECCMDSDATRDGITKAIRKVAHEATEDSRTIVDIVGHGHLSKDHHSSFVTVGCRIDAPDNDKRLMPFDEILREFSLIKSRHKWLIVDACYAGNLSSQLSGQLASGDKPISTLDTFDAWKQETGGAVWLGSDPDAQTHYKRGGRTVLHQAIIDAARQQDYLETLKNLYDDVRLRDVNVSMGRLRDRSYAQMYLGSTLAFSDMASPDRSAQIDGYNLRSLSSARDSIGEKLNSDRIVDESERTEAQIEQATIMLLLYEAGDSPAANLSNAKNVLKGTKTRLKPGSDDDYYTTLLSSYVLIHEPGGNHQGNLNQAIRELNAICFPVRGTKRPLEFANPGLWVRCMGVLGSALFEVERDENGKLLTYRQRVKGSLRVLDKAIQKVNVESFAWADLLCSEANILGGWSASLEEIEKADNCYVKAESVYTKARFARFWSEIERGRQVLRVFADGTQKPDPVNPVEQGESKEPLDSADALPSDRADKLLLKAEVYQENGTLDWEDRKSKIGSSLEAAGKLFTKQDDPVLWARLQMSYGWYCATFFDDQSHQDLARQCFADSLSVFTVDSYPLKHALIVMDKVDLLLSHPEGVDQQDSTLTDVDAVLNEFTRDVDPFVWSKLEEGRATLASRKAARKLDEIGDPRLLDEATKNSLRDSLTDSISSLEEAGKILNEARHPIRFAEINNNITDAYSSLGDIDASMASCAWDPASKAVELYGRFNHPSVLNARGLRGEVCIRQMLNPTVAQLRQALDDLNSILGFVYKPESPTSLGAAIRVLVLDGSLRLGTLKPSDLDLREVQILTGVLEHESSPKFQKYLRIARLLSNQAERTTKAA